MPADPDMIGSSARTLEEETHMDARPRILGVDDSLTIRKALEIVLKPAGYDLELAADGAEALAKAKALQPALILLDFILPDLRGTDVCRQLAADPETAHIPVVLISAKGAEIEQAYRDISNVVSYLAKPFKPPVLTGVVAEVLARASSGALVKLSLTADADRAPDALAPQALPATSEPDSIVAAGCDVSAVEMDVPTSDNTARATSDDLDGLEKEDVGEAPLDDTVAIAARRDRIEWMFETLRSGLEGVYVEEVDTPAGAAADQAKTHTDLIEQLSRQLEEGLRHARSGARHRLYGDGSIRSFDEALLDVFRRSCRVLFRAAAADTGVHEPPPHADRTLIVCRQQSQIHEQLESVLTEHPEWPVVLITENFRQLPLLVRLYGPSLVIAEITWTGALWDQLQVIRRMPEAQVLRMIGITNPAQLADLSEADRQARTALLAERGFTLSLNSAFEIEGVLGGHLADDDVAVEMDELRMAV
jgi:CheY-like chemotaxis protein